VSKIKKKDLLEELDEIFESSKKKKKKKSSLTELKKIKKKKALLKVKDLLKSKKSPKSIVKKYEKEAEEEIQKWLATESGFLEGFTEDVFGNPSSLYGYQIKYLDDRSYFIHIDKARQCLPKGSMVSTPIGPIEIENLKSGDLVYSYNIKKGRIEIDEVVEVWESGIKKCQRFFTRSCNRVEAGKKHPFLLEDNSWKKNKDLEKGDELKYCSGKFGKIKAPKSEILLLAYFITDGSTIIQPKFTNNDKRLIKDFIKAVKIFDPSLIFRTVPKENGLETFPHAKYGTCKKNKVHHILEKWGFRGKRKEVKFLPEEVFLWNRKSVRLLLNRMFCCDGWYSRSRDMVEGVGFGTSNRKLAYQIQQLLWNFGIESKINEYKGGPHPKYGTVRDFWKVIIAYRGSISKFYNEIGIATKQEIPLRHYQHHLREKNRVFKWSEECGDKLCFDISTKKNKNFIFEGLVVHNTGFSYIYAGRSTARSHLQTHHTSIFISINQEEANEKVIYAKGLFESLPLSVKKKIVVDNKHSLEFEDKAGRMKSRTRIISHAQREPRGKGGNVDVYLDEAAHYTWGNEIYVAAVPIITRGTGSLTIGSSPLGKKGIHYDIMAVDSYKRIYTFHRIFWWHCKDFVKRGKFKEAWRKASFMSTEERVVTFGSEKIVGIFISMDIEQFQQEYELLHIDESVSFFPIDLINSCVYEVVIDNLFLEEDEYSEKLTFPIQEKYPKVDFEFYKNIEDLELAIRDGKIEGDLYSGYDVGRKKHSGEFSIIEEKRGKHPLQIIRHLRTFRNKKFRFQKNYLKNCLDVFPNLKMKIDSGGMGEDMAEELGDYSWRVEPIHFDNKWKEEICSDTRIRLEDQLIAIPNLKDVKNQIHSIKRKVTDSGRFIFDAEKNRAHHGDIFWSIAMASSFGVRPIKQRIMIPNMGSGIEKAAPRVVPISQARLFAKTIRPKARMPMGVAGLKSPVEINQLHLREIARG